MKKGGGCLLSKSFFEIEIGCLGVEIEVILYSLILRKIKKIGFIERHVSLLLDIRFLFQKII